METNAHPDRPARMLEAVALALDLEALMRQPFGPRWCQALVRPSVSFSPIGVKIWPPASAPGGVATADKAPLPTV